MRGGGGCLLPGGTPSTCGSPCAPLSLQLTASNHVSNVTVSYNVTVGRMHRMRGLWVSAVPPVLPPNATLALAAHVLVDSAVEVAFL